MIDYTKTEPTSSSDSIDLGLRSYMLKVYQYMSIGLFLTAIVAISTAVFPPMTSLVYSIGPGGEIVGLSLLGTISPWITLGMALYFGFAHQSMSYNSAKIFFWVYSCGMGLSLSYVSLVYTGDSIVRTFFISSALFAAMSIYGYTTKKDLTSFGSFLVMGLMGLILVSIVNVFLASPAIYYATSLIGVFIFIGLTAWDTQKIKNAYYQLGAGKAAQKFAILSAFTLYLDFINLFLYLLRFLGNRR